MIPTTEQSDLIIDLDAAHAFVFEQFRSAAGITGNFKISLPEAFKRNKELMRRFTGHMISELVEVDVIATVGGALDIASEISSETRLPLIEIVKNQNGYFQSKDASSHDLITQNPRIGFIEDVTSTRETTERAINHVHIRPLVDKVVVGWRRGRPAPDGMSVEEIMSYNRRFNFRELYEVPTDLPITPIIERFIPLWLPTEGMMYARLPELSKIEAEA